MNRSARLLALFVGTLCVLPVAYVLLLSMVERWSALVPFPEVVSLRWWREIGARGLSESLVLSMVLSAGVATVATAGGFAAARFVRYARRPRLWLFVAYAPFVLSPVLVGVCLMYLYLRLGVAGTVAGVMLAQFAFALGFATVFFTSFWSGRVRDYEGLAQTLGASPLDVLWRVSWPLARGLVLLCFFQTFLLSWFQYGITLLVGQGKVQTLPLRVFNHLNEANPYVAAVAACLLVLPPVLLLFVNRRVLTPPLDPSLPSRPD